MSEPSSLSEGVSLKAKLLLVLFGIVCACVLAEGALWVLSKTRRGSEFASIDDLRSALDGTGHELDPQGNGVSFKSIIHADPNDDIIYDLQPNLDVTFQRANVRTNSCGMRGPERPIGKPEGTFRIALLGDSFAFGWGVEQKDSFAQRLEDNLNRIAGGRNKVEVLNFGVPGYSTFQETAQFIEKGAAFQPDAILVFFIQNDFGPPFFIRDMSAASTGPSSHIAQLAMSVLDPHAAERALQQEGRDPNRSLNTLADFAKKEGIPLFLAINPRVNWKKYYQQLWVLKSRKDIRFMRLREDFARIVKQRRIASADLTLSFDPHPTPLRHSIYGDIMTPYFIDLIDR